MIDLGKRVFLVIMKMAADRTENTITGSKPAIANFRVNSRQQRWQWEAEVPFDLGNNIKSDGCGKCLRRIHVVAAQWICRTCGNQVEYPIVVHAFLTEPIKVKTMRVNG